MKNGGKRIPILYLISLLLYFSLSGMEQHGSSESCRSIEGSPTGDRTPFDYVQQEGTARLETSTRFAAMSASAERPRWHERCRAFFLNLIERAREKWRNNR